MEKQINIKKIIILLAIILGAYPNTSEAPLSHTYLDKLSPPLVI